MAVYAHNIGMFLNQEIEKIFLIYILFIKVSFSRSKLHWYKFAFFVTAKKRSKTKTF